MGKQKLNTKFAFTLAEVLIAKRKRGKMSLLDLSRKRELKEPSSRFMKQCAFTLAEVLITLGIIGVVAAMTIPTLMNQTNDAEIRSSLKKVYSTLSQATLSATQDNGGSLVGACPDNDSLCFANLLKPYLKTSDFCPGDGSTRCWHKPTDFFWYNKSADGAVNQDWSILPIVTMILSDGALVEIQSGKSNCSIAPDAREFSLFQCATSYVDVNGFKKPNTLGKDIFTFRILPNSVIPAGSPVITNPTYVGTNCPASGDSESCTYYNLFVRK